VVTTSDRPFFVSELILQNYMYIHINDKISENLVHRGGSSYNEQVETNRKEVGLVNELKITYNF
jgi:hypothetical protein